MTQVIKSIDALITATPEAQPMKYEERLEATKIDVSHPSSQVKPVKEVVTPETSDEIDDEPIEKPAKEAEQKEPVPESKADDNNDEYGNPIAKEKTYTEAQVQQMIRDRLKRGQFKQDHTPTANEQDQAQKAGFEYDESSNETWTQQLENFVERTVDKVAEKKQRKQQEADSKNAQAEFEDRFYSGMAKYDDFVQTLSDKPVTNNMLIATRGLKNPAAFLYTAAKRAPQELERISKLADPYAQVIEMGRLHERLSKAKPVTKAAAPLSPDRGDIGDRRPAKVSIDHLIQEDAQKRYRR